MRREQPGRLSSFFHDTAARRTRAGLLVAALAVTAAGAAACAGILGIEDRSPDPTLSDASSSGAAAGEAGSGSSGSGGTSGSSGSSTSGSAGTGTSGSSGSSGASTGDATAGSSTGSPDGGPPDATTVDAPGNPGDAGGGPDVVVTSDAPTCADPCPLATKLNNPFLMASDATNVYWTEYGDDFGFGNGAVKACPLTGCPASGPVLYASGLTNPRGIAVDANNVYYATASYSGVMGGIWSCPIANCTSPRLLAPAGIPYGIAVDATFVYWVDNDDNTVHKVIKMGGASTVLYDGDGGLTVEPALCVVDGMFLYFTDRSASAFSVPIMGGLPAFIGTTSFGGFFGIATDPTNVYYGGEGVIMSAPKGSMDAGVAISSNVADPVDLFYDKTTALLYWANLGSGNYGDGTVGRLATDGGSSRVLHASLRLPVAVTVSGNYLLWLDQGDPTDSGAASAPNTGTIWRTAK